ncbi:MAG TPA: cytochrome c [Acidobacteriota bacterium]
MIVLLMPFFFAVASCGRAEYATGEQAYQGECAKCHKLVGNGGTKGPDLTDIFQKKDAFYIREYTKDPRSFKPDGTMPPSKLTDREIDLVLEYMKEQGRSRK